MKEFKSSDYYNFCRLNKDQLAFIVEFYNAWRREMKAEFNTSYWSEVHEEFKAKFDEEDYLDFCMKDDLGDFITDFANSLDNPDVYCG